MLFSEIISRWYSEHKRDLPWRATKDPYKVWLSEVIMQQTQIAQGLPYYNLFINAFPNVYSLAKATEDEVLKLWQGLGYYSRARHLHTTANIIVNDYDGKFPKTFNALKVLKGVGDYTASAIASICYDEATAVVDGNVYRVLSRCFGIKTPINSVKGNKQFKAVAQKLLPKINIGDYNQAIMEFGAKQCKPKSPCCTVCPFHSKCIAFLTNNVNELPVKIKPKTVTKLYYTFLVFISNNGKTILHKRTLKGIWQHLYQFPLIETKTAIGPETLKQNRVMLQYTKNTGFNLRLYNKKIIVHKLSHRHLYTSFWIVNVKSLPKEAIAISDLKLYAVPVLIENFITDFKF